MSYPKKIISDGSTGAARGGLDAAIMLDIQHGGYCPKGRYTSDSVGKYWNSRNREPIPIQYILTETSNMEPEDARLLNIEKSDGTVMFTATTAMGSGEMVVAAKMLRQLSRKWLHICIRRHEDDTTFRNWLIKYQIHTLNVIGTKESGCAGMQAAVRKMMYREIGRVYEKFAKGGGNRRQADKVVPIKQRSVG